MKNKLFYGLFVAYVAMVVFILYINGVFTGQVASFSNLLINGGFLAIIGVLFLVSVASFIRLNRLTDDLKQTALSLQEEYKKAGNKNLWGALQERKNLFQEGNLQAAYARYCARFRGGRRGKQYVGSCDIEEFINEQLLEKVGSSYFNSAVSGTLTGLGILGTFLGLSMGLGSFQGEDIYTISDNVGPLLSGMKVAFHTSVYGILFSLIFNFVYRSIMSDAYGKLDYFLTVFRQCAAPSGAGSDENAAAMLVYQANMANYMKQMLELSRGEAEAQTAAMDQMADRFLERLQAATGTRFQELGEALKNASYVQAASVKNEKSVMDAAAALTESSRRLQETMEKMLRRQEELSGEISEQGKLLAQACEEISSEVSSQLYTFEQMRTAYED